VSEIWESRERFEAWPEKLMPQLQEAGKASRLKLDPRHSEELTASDSPNALAAP